MSAIITVLLKVFAREFYIRNAMFFLVVLGLCFGFMSDVEHKALARLFISSPTLLMIPMSVWILYSCKVILFNRKMTREPRNAFARDITLLARSKQLLGITPVLTAQFVPVIGYALFLLLVCMQRNFIAVMVWIVLSVCMLLCASVVALYYDLTIQHHEKKTHSIKKFIDIHVHKPYAQFFIEWISRKDPVILLGTKLLSCVILFGVLKLYTTNVYDWRLLGIGLTILFSGNMPLLFQLHKFENFDFQIVRNLPLSISERLLNNIWVFTLLCLPEFGVLIGNFPYGLGYVRLIFSILFSLSVIVFLYSSLYALPADLEKFTRRIFFFSIIEIIVILFNVPLSAIVLVNFAVGTMLFKKYFYTFENNEHAKQ